MTNTFARLDIGATWAQMNLDLIALVDFIPDAQINWSPKPGLWNFRGILIHIAAARDDWLGEVVHDGRDAPGVWQTVRSKPEIQDAYRRTWGRVEAFLADDRRLDAEYTGFRATPVSGHWIAFHLLEHDIHHRADILHYLALLGVDAPSI
ncbi:MAG: DinB family protein [Dehalococcoidia bacterium]